MIKSKTGKQVKELARKEFEQLLKSDEIFNKEYGVGIGKMDSNDIKQLNSNFEDWYETDFLPCLVCEQFGIQAKIVKN